MNEENTILIVDDEPDILEFLSYNFRKKGFRIITADNGKEGMAIALAEHPTIIISDILMPEMNGVEMCLELKNQEAMKSVPIILLTAVNDDYGVQYAMSSGADQYVSKPVKFEYLFTIVELMLLKY